MCFPFIQPLNWWKDCWIEGDGPNEFICHFLISQLFRAICQQLLKSCVRNSNKNRPCRWWAPKMMQCHLLMLQDVDRMPKWLSLNKTHIRDFLITSTRQNEGKVVCMCVWVTHLWWEAVKKKKKRISNCDAHHNLFTPNSDLNYQYIHTACARLSSTRLQLKPGKWFKRSIVVLWSIAHHRKGKVRGNGSVVTSMSKSLRHE